MHRCRTVCALLLFGTLPTLLVAGCDETADGADAGRADSGAVIDAGGAVDAGMTIDSGTDGEVDGGATVGFVSIQADLEARGCTGPGGTCHDSPTRNVWIVHDPDATELAANWDRIVNVDPGVTPWVTPRDDTAQMLNEVSIPATQRARWLEWIVAGAPFDGI